MHDCCLTCSPPSWEVDKVKLHYPTFTDEVTVPRSLAAYYHLTAFAPPFFLRCETETLWNQLFRSGEKKKNLKNYSTQNPYLKI